MSENASTTSGASALDDKTATVQYTLDFSCVEKVRKLRIPYGTRETRTYHLSNHMGLDRLADSCVRVHVRLMISTAISFCMSVLSSESLGAMEEDDVSTWWNDWG